MKFGDKNAAVKELQKQLQVLGFALDPDGDLGAVTWNALVRFANIADRNAPSKNEAVPNDLLQQISLTALYGSVRVATTDALSTFTGIKVFNLISEQQPLIPRSKDVNGRVTLMRTPKEVTGICVHQTAVNFGVTAKNLQKYVDRDLAEAHRYLDVPAHVCAMREGSLVVHAPAQAYLYHGNAFNADTLGYEIEGSYPGVFSSRNDKHDKLTSKVIETARKGIDLLMYMGSRAGMDIQYIYAHRQSSDTRRGDPGEEIWREVVLNYAVPQYNLQVRNNHVRRDGRPIPSAWDARSSAKF